MVYYIEGENNIDHVIIVQLCLIKVSGSLLLLLKCVFNP